MWKKEETHLVKKNKKNNNKHLEKKQTLRQGNSGIASLCINYTTMGTPGPHQWQSHLPLYTTECTVQVPLFLTTSPAIGHIISGRCNTVQESLPRRSVCLLLIRHLVHTTDHVGRQRLVCEKQQPRNNFLTERWSCVPSTGTSHTMRDVGGVASLVSCR